MDFDRFCRALAALFLVGALGACTVTVDEGRDGLSRSQVRNMICDMVDEEALEDSDDCD